MAAFDTHRGNGADRNPTGRTVFFFDALTGTNPFLKGQNPVGRALRR